MLSLLGSSLYGFQSLGICIWQGDGLAGCLRADCGLIDLDANCARDFRYATSPLAWLAGGRFHPQVGLTVIDAS
jgi:hypothetical protein